MTSAINIDVTSPKNASEREALVSAMKKVDWDAFFMYRAFMIAIQSPDMQTKQGIILVDTPTHRVISEGFNGFPPGANDSELPRTRPDKYSYIVHCEPNAFNWAARLGARFGDVTAYMTMGPCETCTRNHIVAVSNITVKRIVYWEERDHPESKKILSMFPGISIERFDGGVDRIFASGVATLPLQYMLCTPQTGRFDNGWATNYSVPDRR